MRRNESSRRLSLATKTSFRIGGTSRHWVAPADTEELRRVVVDLETERTPYFVLGGGTNTIFGDDGFAGCVISTERLDRIEVREPRRLVVEPGVPLRRVIREAIKHGWGGLEEFVGIPGSIGGAVWGNAGGADRAVGDRVASVTWVEPDGRLNTIAGREIDWRYRSSGLGRRVIASIELEFLPGDRETLAAAAKECFNRKRDTQPLSAWSAGCIFRNPPGHAAARLIEEAGLKGESVGDARVSEHHANFIVNTGEATAEDVRRLIERVQARVHEAFGVTLEREIIDPTGALGATVDASDSSEEKGPDGA